MSESDESEIERVDMKVYDMPVELKNKYISKAKLDYDNQLWKVLEEGMDKMIEERETKVPRLEARVENLEEQIAYLKVKLEEQKGQDLSEKDDGAPATFGGGKEDDLDKSDDEILDKFDRK